MHLSNGSLFVTIGNVKKYVQNGEMYISSDDLSSYSGKIIKIDLTSKVTEIISRGHRNSQGIVFTYDGYLVATEHGPQGGDEINLIKKGKHYGYPYRTFGTDYGKYTYSGPENKKNFLFEDPIFDFSPSIGISSIIELDGFSPAWDKNLLVGSLKGKSIYRIRRTNDKILSLEKIYIGSRIRSMAQLKKK